MIRRGVYGSISRVFPNNFETTFDLPTPTFSAEKRYATNVPLQRLFFLNSPFVEQQADGLARRVRDAGNEEAQVRKAYAIVFQRQPTAAELQASLDFLHQPVAEAPRGSVSNSIAAKPAPPGNSGARCSSTGRTHRIPYEMAVLGLAEFERISVRQLRQASAPTGLQRLSGQKTNFIASCMILGSRAEVIWPKLLALKAVEMPDIPVPTPDG